LPVKVASVKINGSCTFSRDTAQNTLFSGRVTLVLYLCMWLLGSPDTDIVSDHLATDVECGFIGEDQSFYETNLPPSSNASPPKIQAFSLCLLLYGSASIAYCTV
jgi:hypothetical protein